MTTGQPRPIAKTDETAAHRAGGSLWSDAQVFSTLAKRRDFLAAARARRQAAPAFTLQARERGQHEGRDGIHVGYTCSKKVGNAVARNRAKRRLRAIARSILALHGKPGWDYVLIGRPVSTATRPFAEMEQDLLRALAGVHAPRAGRR